MLRVCFHFCFEYVDTLHFGNSVHEVLSPAVITGRSVWDNAEVLLPVIIVWQGYLALIMKKNVSFYNNFYFR